MSQIQVRELKSYEAMEIVRKVHRVLVEEYMAENKLTLDIELFGLLLHNRIWDAMYNVTEGTTQE